MNARQLKSYAHNFDKLPQAESINLFALDLLNFFRGLKEGHMERWEYWHADYLNDPAGGSAFWEALIKKPHNYYLPMADITAIKSATQNENFLSELSRFKTIVELGPGSARSIQEKTIPILKYAKKYIALDQTPELATDAAAQVHKITGIVATTCIAHYHYPPIKKLNREPTAFVMWGGAIGNIEGHKNESADKKLLEIYKIFAANCNAGDAYIVPFDVEQDASKVLAAYHEPLLSKKFLSILYAAKKFGLISGQFNPDVWRHRSEFYAETGQCAHILFPLKDQKFSIRGHDIHIKAFEPRITNNSYKFKEQTIRDALKGSSFSKIHIFKEHPMALTVAIK